MPNKSKDGASGDSQTAIMKSLIQRHLTSTLARYAPTATPRDWWVASTLAVRDAIHERMIATQMVHNAQNTRRIYYFSMEYLMGRLFESNLLATGLTDSVRSALESMGVKYDDVREAEVDMALGNGGLGRLAACFLDSLATLDYPALGYGIHYEFGLFKQEIVNGCQVEHPDRWMIFGSPWEVIRADYTQEVQVYGKVVNEFDNHGN
jgi:glycogen phosphorylase